MRYLFSDITQSFLAPPFRMLLQRLFQQIILNCQLSQYLQLFNSTLYSTHLFANIEERPGRLPSVVFQRRNPMRQVLLQDIVGSDSLVMRWSLESLLQLQYLLLQPGLGRGKCLHSLLQQPLVPVLLVIFNRYFFLHTHLILLLMLEQLFLLVNGYGSSPLLRMVIQYNTLCSTVACIQYVYYCNVQKKFTNYKIQLIK